MTLCLGLGLLSAAWLGPAPIQSLVSQTVACTSTQMLLKPGQINEMAINSISGSPPKSKSG